MEVLPIMSNSYWRNKSSRWMLNLITLHRFLRHIVKLNCFIAGFPCFRWFACIIILHLLCRIALHCTVMPFHIHITLHNCGVLYLHTSCINLHFIAYSFASPWLHCIAIYIALFGIVMTITLYYIHCIALHCITFQIKKSNIITYTLQKGKMMKCTHQCRSAKPKYSICLFRK